MKPILFRSIISLLLFTLVFSISGTAESQGSSVIGNFQISTGVGPTRHIEFKASRDRNGYTIGETVFRDRPESDTKSEVADRSADSSSTFWLKAQFDCLVISGNRAVMGGSVTESNSQSYIGQRLLMVVEDGDGFKPQERDKLTFGIYQQAARDWLPSDSERAVEEGWAAEWVARDSERDDDDPVSPRKSEVKRCDSFPISAFSFINENLGRGSIQVRP